MKNLLNLLKIEYIFTKRNVGSFVIGIGLPVGLFLLITTMMTKDIPQEVLPIVIRDFMVSMAIYSSLSFALFTFPIALVEDRNNNWFLFIEQAPIKIWQYYIAKFIRVFINFVIGIIIVFSVAKYFKDVNLELREWIISLSLALLGSSCMLGFGLLLSQIKSTEKLSVVSNVLYIFLGMVGGLWWPISQFPDALKNIAKTMPTHHARELVVNYLNKHEIAYNSLLILFGYVIILIIITIIVRNKQR